MHNHLDHQELAEEALYNALAAAQMLARYPLPEKRCMASRMAADLLDILSHTTNLEQDALIQILAPGARRLQLERERLARIDRAESEELDREFQARCTTAQ